MTAGHSSWTGDPQTVAYRRASLILLGLALGLVGILSGVLVLPPVVAVLMFAAILGVGWTVFAALKPLPALMIVFFIVILAYSRLNFGSLNVAGPSTSNRGAIALGDILWVGLAAGSVLRWGALRGRDVVDWLTEAADEPLVWAMAPYVLVAVSLPLLGVMTGDWPASYAVPGPRVLQHVGLGLIGYLLTRERGAGPVLRAMIATIAIAGALHVGYALIQFAYSAGIVGPAWVALDFLYSAQHNVGWFFYPRLTGLLVNPNAYGLLGSCMLVLALALILARASTERRWIILLVLAGAFAVMFSGSRSALVGLAAAGLIVSLLALRHDALMTRWVRLVVLALVVVVAAGTIAWPMLPPTLQGRYIRLFGVLTQGTQADVNAVGRLETWHEALRIYWNQYPLGTWVAASYALELPIDSYYMSSTVQGTPAFTLLWIISFVSASALGYKAYRRSHSGIHAAAGLTLAGWAGVLLGGSLTLSPVLQAHLIEPFWLLAGVVVAIVRTARPTAPTAEPAS